MTVFSVFASSEAHEPNMVQGEALLEGEACSSRGEGRSFRGAISAFRFYPIFPFSPHFHWGNRPKNLQSLKKVNSHIESYY